MVFLSHVRLLLAIILFTTAPLLGMQSARTTPRKSFLIKGLPCLKIKTGPFVSNAQSARGCDRCKVWEEKRTAKPKVLKIEHRTKRFMEILHRAAELEQTKGNRA